MSRVVMCFLAGMLSIMGATFAETPLNVISFNIRYGTARDGENAWPHRRALLVETIEKFNPDVVGLQECLRFQVQYIVKRLPEYRWIGIGRDADGSGEMTAILCRYDSLVPLQSGHFWLSEHPDIPGSVSWDSSLTRMASWVLFYHPETQQRFYFFNTHFDHRGEEARVQSAHLLAARGNDAAKKYPVIVTGDFNAEAESSEPWKVFQKEGFKDARLSAEKKIGPAVTWGAFKAPEPNSDKRIDWILHRGPVKPVSCETVLDNEDGRYPSDHYPVFVKFILGE